MSEQSWWPVAARPDPDHTDPDRTGHTDDGDPDHTDTQPAPARRRRRRWPWVLLVLVVVVAVLLVVADRWTHSYAERTVAEKLGEQSAFSSPPTVTIAGSPFLTQAVRGTYDHVTVAGRGLTLGSLADVTFDADLTGVHVPLSDVISGSVRQVTVDRASGSLVIPYSEFAQETGIDGLTITEKNGTLTVTAPVRVQISFIDETFDVVADGTVAAAGGGTSDVNLDVENIRVAGVSLPGFVVGFIGDYLNSRVDLPDLPYGLQLQSVNAQSDGLHVAVAGTNLTIDTS